MGASDLVCENDDICGWFAKCIITVGNQSGICEHIAIWPPSAGEAVILLIIPFFVGIVNVGGLGGGVCQVPLIVLLLNYSQKYATFLAYPLTFGSSIVNVFLLLLQRHPNQNRPIIDFGVSLIFTPAILEGTNIGILLNKTLPDIALSLTFVIFITGVTPYLWKTAVKQRQAQQILRQEEKNNKLHSKEAEEEARIDRSNSEQADVNLGDIMKRYNQDTHSSLDSKDQEAENDQPFIVQNLSPLGINNDYQNNMGQEINESAKIDAYNHQYFMNDDQQLFPRKQVLLLLICFLLMQFFNFGRGTKETPSFMGVELCGDSYWALFYLQIVFVLIFEVFVYKFLKKEETIQIQSKYDYDPADFQVTPGNFAKVAFAGLFSGTLAGMTGAGAGLINMPTLLYMGMNPRVAGATSSFMYLFIAITQIITTFTERFLPLSDVLLFFFLGFLGGAVVANLLYRYVEKHKNASTIVFIVVGIAILNVICTFLYVSRKANRFGWSTMLHGNPLC